MRWFAAMAAVPAGAALQLHERSLLAEPLYPALIAFGLLLVALGWRWRHRLPLAALALAGLALVGFGSTG